ncbi:MAG: hypothetical protein WBD25_00815 [Terriglobales bacterium]
MPDSRLRATDSLPCTVAIPVRKQEKMPKRKITPNDAANGIRRMLKNGGSADHATGVQWFFKEEIKSHGWYTAALRKAAVQF